MRLASSRAIARELTPAHAGAARPPARPRVRQRAGRCLPGSGISSTSSPNGASSPETQRPLLAPTDLELQLTERAENRRTNANGGRVAGDPAGLAGAPRRLLRRG